MFQKEVVDRLVATPRTKEYGRLSVLAQHVCEIRRLFDIPAAAFGQRRKMLRGALAGIFADPVATLEGIGLSPTARAEELSIADFIRLAEMPFK